MFEVTFTDATVFKKCIDAISTLIDEGEFVANDQGLSLRAMDPSQIAMVDFQLPKTAFESYSSNTTKLGVNMEDFATVMSRVRAGERMEMKLDESKSRLILTFRGHSRRRFVVPLLDLESNTPKEPQIEFESIAKLNGTFLKESLKDTQLVSSHVILNAQPDAFIVQAQGDKGGVNIKTEKGSKQIIEYTVNKEARAMFPLDYLNDLLKNVDSTTNVLLSLCMNAPLQLKYDIGDAHITYYLAPRIEEE
ncbi:proliferating cell nuclear antigen (pcna) [archaeon]|nr:proliferating cell nuclear antigen (pcna) [archaeon]